MPSDAPPPTAHDDPEELRRWIDVLRDAYRRNAHIDLVAFGEFDQSTTTCWSTSCPVADQKAEFLRWLADTINDADIFFVPEEEQ